MYLIALRRIKAASIDFMFSFCLPTLATIHKNSEGKTKKKTKINANSLLAAVTLHKPSE
jgi:hypothetical protein